MKIVKLERSKHKKGRVLLYTENGDLLRVTDSEVLAFDLYSGRELEDDQAEALRESARRSSLAERAAQLSAGRMLSRKELSDRLRRKGAAPDEADALAQRMEELGAVDDAAYAGVIVRHYAAMGYGRGRVEQELFRRGIDKSLWEQALSELPDDEEAIERFLARKGKTGAPDGASRKKLADALVRRGFPWDAVRAVLARPGEEVFENE
ncbi:MAG: regulatory protein RecX [Oscillospiraceae bacterium]|nr:regulatory protein RecX [Oscillospiraceae bacterium]